MAINFRFPCKYEAGTLIIVHSHIPGSESRKQSNRGQFSNSISLLGRLAKIFNGYPPRGRLTEPKDDLSVLRMITNAGMPTFNVHQITERMHPSERTLDSVGRIRKMMNDLVGQLHSDLQVMTDPQAKVILRAAEETISKAMKAIKDFEQKQLPDYPEPLNLG